jgi:hypothetical protein
MGAGAAGAGDNGCAEGFMITEKTASEIARRAKNKSDAEFFMEHQGDATRVKLEVDFLLGGAWITAPMCMEFKIDINELKAMLEKLIEHEAALLVGLNYIAVQEAQDQGAKQ